MREPTSLGLAVSLALHCGLIALLLLAPWAGRAVNPSSSASLQPLLTFIDIAASDTPTKAVVSQSQTAVRPAVDPVPNDISKQPLPEPLFLAPSTPPVANTLAASPAADTSVTPSATTAPPVQAALPLSPAVAVATPIAGNRNGYDDPYAGAAPAQHAQIAQEPVNTMAGASLNLNQPLYAKLIKQFRKKYALSEPMQLLAEVDAHGLVVDIAWLNAPNATVQAELYQRLVGQTLFTTQGSLADKLWQALPTVAP